MGFLKKLFGRDFEDQAVEESADAIVAKVGNENVVTCRKLAFEMCVQRIARAISKCEFRVYKNGKEQRNDWYYTLNVRPNPNESATRFWERFIHKLYYDGEVLVLPMSGTINGESVDCLYLADAFVNNTRKEFRARSFSNVVIGDVTLKRSFTTDTAFYFKLGNQRIKAYLDETAAIYCSLMSSAQTAYKQSNGLRYKLKIERAFEPGNEKDEKLKAAMKKSLKEFASGDSGAWMETKGTELTTIGGTGSVKDTRDIKALLDDILEITCKAFLMPTNIMTGEVTDTSKAVDDFLTFCLDAVVEMIQDTLNAGVFTREQYLKGAHIKIDTRAIKHIDVLDMASSVDKLLSSGVYSINDIMRVLGDEPIDEEWADQHFMTKNYSPMTELMTALGEEKGGSQGEDEKDGLSDAAGSEDGGHGGP